ncbi:MAG: hypothetical protein JRE10_15655, partial [Deltaproteobacteria bacterium]|nr:hypothetical protein [Deltaproteobacteria bacterium]
ILKKDKTWTVVAAIASSIAAIAALLAIFQTSSILKSERDFRRPYLKIYEATMQKIDKENTFTFKVALENIGIDPLRDPQMKLLVKNISLDKDLFNVFYSYAGDTPPGGTLSFVRRSIKSSEITDNAYYVILVFRYKDPILEKEFAQRYFLKWRTELIKLERVLVSKREDILKDQDLKLPLNDENIIKQIWKNN